MSALVVDDEESARKLMQKLLEETGYFDEILVAGSAETAHRTLTDFNPDIIFLDIKMPGKYGIDFVNELEFRDDLPGIVFVTAHEEYAIPAIKVRAFDYLLKPVNRRELKQCVENFREKILAARSRKQSPEDRIKKISRIKVNTRTGTVFINPSSILYCRAEGNYSTICTGEKEYLCSINLGKIQELLPAGNFLRIGRSLILNYEHITLLDRKKSTVTLVRGNETVTVKIPHQHMKDLDML